jgi:hypothetical protein
MLTAAFRLQFASNSTDILLIDIPRRYPMKIASFVVAAAAAALLSSAALAGGSTTCGCAPAPVKVKANSGVGNGGEPRTRAGEVGDVDPGNSGAHNQAYTNQSKPQSAAGRLP